MISQNNDRVQGYFCITIDTEEEGRWGGGYPRTAHSVEHIKELPRLQQLFNKHKVKPVYLVDYPVVKNATSCSILKNIHDSRECEIGGHVHPWCNPPFEEKNDSYHSYLCNLPAKLQKEKIRILTEEIELAFGVKPLSFRAGRYGADAKTISILESLGYLVDSSVTPYMNWESDGGPSFLSAPVIPYYPGSESIDISGEKRTLIELPVSVGFNRSQFEKAHKVREYLSSKKLFRTIHAIGILDRLSALEKIFLSPELSSLESMLRLSTMFVYKKIPLLIMMFHSTAISPGKTPYVRNMDDLENFYRKLDDYIAYVTHELNLRNTTLINFRNIYTGD